MFLQSNYLFYTLQKDCHSFLALSYCPILYLSFFMCTFVTILFIINVKNYNGKRKNHIDG